jgi:hypothetical protein
MSGQVTDKDAPSATLKFINYCTRSHLEDIFIHCDRDIYVAGENIFLKAYLFNRDSLIQSGTSTYAYVELINPYNKPVAQIKVSILNGKGSSVISIPDTVMNGKYLIRAYTSAMKNYMPYGCFMKGLMITNPFSNNFSNLNFNPTRRKEDPYKISFWPEGGKLIAGLPARVGINSFDRFGNPALFTGSVLDGDGKTITTITVDSSGIGLVEFIPQKGMIYTAVNADSRKKFPLPNVFDNGISLHVTQTGADSLRITIIKSSELPQVSANIELIIRFSGKIAFYKKIHLENSETTIMLPGEILEKGINDIAILDGSGKLAAEKYIFVSARKPEKDILIAQKQYNKRQKIQYEIVPEQPGQISPMSDLSVSIAPLFPGSNISTMNEYLVFGSEYRVENIPYDIAPLFFKLSQEKQEILLLGLTDNLFDWNNILENRTNPDEFPVETGGQYLIVSGLQSVINEEDRFKPAFMMWPGKIPELFYSFPDNKNRFMFFIEKGEMDKDIIIQLPDSTGDTQYKVDNPFTRNYIPVNFQIDTTKPVIPEPVQMMVRNFQVMKIYDIPGMRLTKEDSQPVTSKIRFYGKPDQELIMKNYIILPTMQEVFLELIPLVAIRTIDKAVRFHIIDPISNTALKGDPLLLIDGVRYKDADIMMNLKPDRVEKIDIIASYYLIGDLIFSGIINVITKTGDLSEVPLPVKSLRITYKEYDPPAEFVSPDYSDTMSSIKRIPDFRNTIFWTDSHKPASKDNFVIEFNSSDFSSDYILNIAGTDESGHPFSYKRSFTIK